MRLIPIALLAFLLFAGLSFAWLDGWEYRTPINITSSTSLSDYQVQVDPQIYSTTGLVGSWHFSESSGTIAVDSSGNNNDGTLTNGPVWTSGKFGNGLQLDGVDDYVSIPDSSDWDFSSDFTVEAWFKGSPPSAGYSTLVGRVSGTGGGWADIDWVMVLKTDGTLMGQTSNNGATGSTIFSTTSVGDTAWHHIVYRKTGSTFDFVIDGVVDGTGTYSLTVRNSANPVRIGWGYGTPYYTNGIIDEVSIYNRSLSPEEIQEHYTASKARLDYADLRFTQDYSIYETPISISGTGSELIDFQVLVDITDLTILSHMSPDGSDLRFFSTSTSAPYSQSGLSYWVESVNSTNAKVWVKTNISASGTTIYMYYGNFSAQTESSGSGTFLFFDDFDSGAIPDKWTVVSGTWNNADGLLKSTSASAKLRVSTPLGITSGYVLEYKTILKGSTNEVLSWVEVNAAEAPWAPINANGYTSNIRDDAYMPNAIRYDYGNDATVTVSGLNNNEWLVAKHYVLGDSNDRLEVWKDGVLLGSDTRSGAVNTNGGYFGPTYSTYSRAEYDYFLARKVASTEPIATLGSESAISTDNELSLKHWMENDKSAWVNVPSVPLGDSSIHMYHGNENAATESNGSATFDFFDDFSGDLSKWTAYGSTSCSPSDFSVSTGILVMANSRNPARYLRTLDELPVSSNFTLLTRVKAKKTCDYPATRVFINPLSSADYTGVKSCLYADVDRIYYQYGPSYTSVSLAADTFYLVKLDVGSAGEGTMSVYSDAGVFLADNSETISVDGSYLSIGGTHSNGEMDWIRVSKFSSVEPSTSIGIQEQPDTTPPLVSIQSPDESDNYVSEPDLNFTVSEDASSCWYSLDDWMTNISIPDCTNSTVSGSSEGSNTLKFAAADSVGNLNDTESVSYTFSSAAEQPVKGSAPISTGLASATLDISSLSSPAQLSLRVGSQAFSSSFIVSDGVQSITIHANVTSGGVALSDGTLYFQVS